MIYDILGNEVLKLINNELITAGSFSVDFNGVNIMWRRYRREEECKVMVNKWPAVAGSLTCMDATINKYQ